MSVAEDSRSWWFYCTILPVVSSVSLAGTPQRGRKRQVKLTLHTTVLHLRHSATMSRAQLPDLPL